MKLYLVTPLIFFLVGCASTGSFNSQVTPGYQPPTGKEIALIYLDHADIDIQNAATKILENQLRKCQRIDFLSAEKTFNLLQKNKIVLPSRLSESFVVSLQNIIPTHYLLTGRVSVWKKGAPADPVASSTEVSAALTMYDLTTGKIIWTVTGQEEGGTGIFAEDPSTKANTVFYTMLSKWNGFCAFHK